MWAFTINYPAIIQNNPIKTKEILIGLAKYLIIIKFHSVNREIGNRIKRIRISKGFETKDFADAIGVNNTSLSKIERLGTNSLKTLVKIAETLGINICELFEEPSKANLKETKGEYGYITKHEFNARFSELELSILKITKTLEGIKEQLPKKKVAVKKVSKKK